MSETAFVSRRRMTGLGCAALVLLATACGDDGGAAGGSSSVGTQPGPDDPLTVIAEDIDFPHDEYRVEAGEVDVVYENEGRIVHTLVIDGVDGFKLAVNSKGDVDEGSVEVEPGEYDLYCDIPGHRRAGMEATLVAT